MSLTDSEKKQVIKALGLHQKKLEDMESDLRSFEDMKKQMERMQNDLDFLKQREMKRYRDSLYKTIH